MTDCSRILYEQEQSMREIIRVAGDVIDAWRDPDEDAYWDGAIARQIDRLNAALTHQRVAAKRTIRLVNLPG